MKVLFAVSNEEISESIVKGYQKEYKEIISYKNVYYFNAILKELQKDKSYDRIVISEELEAFTNAQYSQIDKFIFDKLDNISDEASNQKGEDIPIILLCSDRRIKSEEMLVKIFGIGVYNALLGNDRSVNNVCKLLNKPRLKKEAKIYYKIDSDDVSYQSENENDVSEVEIQNILVHYKRLGKDEKRYVTSFDNIASQYNDVQLRVISKFLPLNVRAVLEEKSTKYQQIISYNSRVSDNLRNSSINVKKDTTSGTSEKLLKSEKKENVLSKPVVIPSSVNTSGSKKLAKVKNEVKPIEEISETEKRRIDVRKIGPMFEEETIKQYETKEKPVEKKLDIEEEIKQEKRGRGRPRKKIEVEDKPAVTTEKRGRGRPKKNVAKNDLEEINLTDIDDIDEVEETILPKFVDTEKNKVNKTTNYFEDEETILPGFEDIEDEEEMTLPGFEDIEDEEEMTLPGFEDVEDEEETTLPRFEDIEDEEETTLPGFEDIEDEEETTLPRFEDLEDEEKKSISEFKSPNNKVGNGLSGFENVDKNINMKNKSDLMIGKQYNNVDISGLLTANKKIACFVGTSKNGTSFIVNNLAQVTSQMGIDTAILDTTKNRNSYYIYTKNEENLRKTAMQSINNLLNGNANGIQVNKNLTVYTSLPEESEGLENAGIILQTLLKKHSLILIDCDFDTPVEYFEKTQEIYLVQSYDILTIQPLTAFIRELKANNLISQSKLKVILNKAVKLRGINEKNIIGGMAYYNDPAMSFMTELFDKNTIRYIAIPFNEDVYTKYLENIVNCEVSTRGYPKNIMQTFNELSNIVYPLISGKSTYVPPSVEKSAFTPSMNSTLNQMKNRY